MKKYLILYFCGATITFSQNLRPKPPLPAKTVNTETAENSEKDGEESKIEIKSKKDTRPDTAGAQSAEKLSNTSTTKDTDELPFPPPIIDKRENVFGDKKDKDRILDKMEYQIGFISEGGMFNNADLRKLDESNIASIQNTDDRVSLAYSRFFVNFFFPVTENFLFRVDIFKNGFWGRDQLSGASTNNSSSSTPVGADTFNFGELYLQTIILSNKSFDLSVKIGRQFFEIGGATQDYFMRDYLDALTVQYGDGRLGTFRLLALDVYQMAGDATEHANYVRFFSHDNARVQNFDGDVNVLRTGIVYDSRNILKWKGSLEGNLLQTKLYWFGARYGAVNRGGSDRSNIGSTGNFADNDATMMAGNRWIANFDLTKNMRLKNYADFALSFGVDRRLPTAAGETQDVDNNGYAVGGGSTFEMTGITSFLGADASADVFYASGSKYDKNGVLTSHGFVSFKGNHIGGLLMNRFYGIHPSSYTDGAGISDFAHDYDRKSGTFIVHAGTGATFWEKLRVSFDWWLAADTGESALVQSSSVTSTVLKAQERLGKSLGQEIDVGIDYAHNKYWTVYAKAGIFMPGSFYATPGVKNDSPYGTDTFYGFIFGSRLVF